MRLWSGDYNLWEVAYLLSKGLDLPRILDYRRMINRMTAEQMKTSGAEPSRLHAVNPHPSAWKLRRRWPLAEAQIAICHPARRGARDAG